MSYFIEGIGEVECIAEWNEGLLRLYYAPKPKNNPKYICSGNYLWDVPTTLKSPGKVSAAFVSFKWTATLYKYLTWLFNTVELQVPEPEIVKQSYRLASDPDLLDQLALNWVTDERSMLVPALASKANYAPYMKISYPTGYIETALGIEVSEFRAIFITGEPPSAAAIKSILSL